MALADTDRLRQLLGERIPAGGSAADTLFSDPEIQDFLDRANNDLNLAAYYGWEAKAAELANLVNTSEGNSQRQMSNLHDHALAQMKNYASATGDVSGRGRVKIRQISRTLGA